MSRDSCKNRLYQIHFDCWLNLLTIVVSHAHPLRFKLNAKKQKTQESLATCSSEHILQHTSGLLSAFIGWKLNGGAGVTEEQTLTTHAP